MKNNILLLLFILTLFGCEGNTGWFKIRGSFDHLEQGEFLIYSEEGGLNTIDTIRLQGGKFEYSTPLTTPATFHIIYPNYSELTLFGTPGKTIRIEGDARALNEVKVKGTPDNEIYTSYRKESNPLKGERLDSLTKNYILEHPTLQASKFLLQNHYLTPANKVSNEEIKEIYDSLCRANPNDIELSKIYNDVRYKNVLQVGNKIPAFEITTRTVNFAPRFSKTSQKTHKVIESRVITDTCFKRKPLLIVFWATWRSGAGAAIFRAKKLQKENKDKIGIVCYSLDVEDKELSIAERRDSIDMPSYCDFHCWNSTLVTQWGIREIPFYILTDKDRKIIATGTNWAKDIEPHTQSLCL